FLLTSRRRHTTSKRDWSSDVCSSELCCGDGRTFILGTEGYIELRKYIDVTTDNGGGQVLLVDDRGEHRINATGEVGYPFFGDLILDVLNRTENAMTQAHAFKAVELAIAAQEQARELTGRQG